MKPLASLSLDLDNQWSYMKTHGDAGWDSFPSYLDVLVPRVVEFLKARNLTITVFVVGQDAALAKNRPALRALAAAGHEIGNHSFRHEPWLHLYSEAEVEKELASAEEHIARATGQRPRGFRGPGFSLSSTVLRALARKGYLYDCSTFPTYLGPLARAYYFMTSRFSSEEREQRKGLFGNMRDGLRSLKPYQWRLEEGALTEIPVTTMPLFKIPIHVSYLLYLSVLSPSLALAYFRLALLLCRLTRTQVSLLLHPLDFLGGDDVPALSFFPGMGLTAEQKMKVVSDALRLLTDKYTVVTMRQHASDVTTRPAVPLVEPSFSHGSEMVRQRGGSPAVRS